MVQLFQSHGHSRHVVALFWPPLQPGLPAVRPGQLRGTQLEGGAGEAGRTKRGFRVSGLLTFVGRIMQTSVFPFL